MPNLRLNKLELIHFKNHTLSEFQTDFDIVAFVGNNGVGKTNVLDGIHYLALTKSFLGTTDVMNVEDEALFFSIIAQLDEGEKLRKVNLSFQKGQKKRIKVDNKLIEQLGDYVGSFPVVLIAPNDIELVIGASALRRKFMNASIAQFDKQYLNDVQKANKLWLQRNTLLKNTPLDHTLLEVLDLQWIAINERIHAARKQFISDFNPIFLNKYKQLAKVEEEVSLSLKTDVIADGFEAVLKGALQNDLFRKHSTVGIHRDDLEFNIRGKSLNKVGSQGQQKTFLIAMKLAQYEYLLQKGGKAPFLLLDDIFDKLDNQRMQNLLDLIDAENFGQTFVTDTDSERVEKVLSKLHKTYKIYEL